jgi:kynurenine 3-monooxygenase
MLEEVRKIVIPMKGRMMHSIDGKLTFQSYSKDGKCAIYSVSRFVTSPITSSEK